MEMPLHAPVGLCGAHGHSPPSSPAADPVDIGSRRELFVDDFLIGHMTGDVALHLHKPEPKEVVFHTDKPWEGNTSWNFTLFQDGAKYRMYYRASNDGEGRKPTHQQSICYAESADGIRWTRPNLGLIAWNGSTLNNMMMQGGYGTVGLVPFKDTNPDCPPEDRYKATAQGEHGVGNGMVVLRSSDAIHWSLFQHNPVITKGSFDSQNVSFWDPVTKAYRAYYRHYDRRQKGPGRRIIVTCTSRDYVRWSKPKWLVYPGSPEEQLYTQPIKPYDRAPHIMIGFPARYLPKEGHSVEPLFMSSRDGLTFHRWSEAVISRSAPEDRDGNRSNYMAYGILELPGRPNHLSVYATEAYFKGPDTRLRRFEYRKDGFVSLRGGDKGGEVVSKPFVFTGKRLSVNFAESGAGWVRVEIQDAEGEPMPGFALNQCTPLKGDDIERTVEWESGTDIRTLAGKPIRLRFLINNADVYSLVFID